MNLLENLLNDYTKTETFAFCAAEQPHVGLKVGIMEASPWFQAELRKVVRIFHELFTSFHLSYMPKIVKFGLKGQTYLRMFLNKKGCFTSFLNVFLWPKPQHGF